MKTYLECIPCFLRQAIDAAKLAGANVEKQNIVREKVAGILPGFSSDITPPEIARSVYSIVEEYTGEKNVYKSIKERSNAQAMALYPELKEMVAAAADPLESAVRLAVAGNVIDYGLPHVFDLETEIMECLDRDFAIFDYELLKQMVGRAENILYLLDNAGEILFDRILIEQMGKNVVCAVRDKPVINDVTMEDAGQIGLDKVSKVISSGSDVPGTVVKNCTNEFMEYYNNADLVISKGQGNFETLTEEKRQIFFIFKAKCPVVASHINVKVGDIILLSLPGC